MYSRVYSSVTQQVLVIFYFVNLKKLRKPDNEKNRALIYLLKSNHYASIYWTLLFLYILLTTGNLAIHLK